MNLDHVSLASINSNVFTSKHTTSSSSKSISRPDIGSIPGMHYDAIVKVSDKAFQELATSDSPTPKPSFEIDNSSYQIMVNMLDPESTEVIQQIPILFHLYPSGSK